MKYVYRIIDALLAAAVFTNLLFTDLIFFQASTTLFDAGLEESVNLKKIIDILSGNDSLSGLLPEAGSFKWPAAFDPINGRLIACGVAIALALIAALFIIVWSICSNRRIPVVAASGCGIVATIVMICCFNSAAFEITSGNINIIKAFSDGLIATLAGGIVNVDTLTLGGFQNGMLILFGAIIVWNLCFWLIEIGDEDAKKEKEARKAKKAKK